MSRLSRPASKARESIFSTRPEIYRGDTLAICPPDLTECVAALEDCCEEAHAAQTFLRSGTQDFPRMRKVLESQKVFLLVSDATVSRYKSELASQIDSAVGQLIHRAEEGIKGLERKESQMRSRLDTLQSRPARPASGTSAAHKLETRKYNALIKQREQLEAQLELLETEVEELEASL